jgi:signal transduction histidine kinase
LLDKGIHDLVHHTHPDGRPYPVEECPISRAVREGVARRVEDEVFWRKDGGSFDVEYTITPIQDGERIGGAVVMFSDISARKQAEREVRQSYAALKELNAKLVDAQNQLLQSEKMASIGQLAAGVAHEINNPIGFVNSNLGTLQRYVDDLLRLVEAYDTGVEEGRKMGQEIDLGFLKQDIVSLVGESQDGVARVKRIVQDLKDFSHVDEAEWQWADLNHGLDSTLNVVWNEIKYKAEVVRDFGDIPRLYCLPHQVNQVFMNLLLNAAQAIDNRGVITLRTRREGAGVQIEIADTGQGIPPEVLPRIFEPFYTTKPVGKGTGLGLSLAYGIVEKHQGRIEVESEVGRGTAFRIWLPVREPEAAVK